MDIQVFCYLAVGLFLLKTLYFGFRYISGDLYEAKLQAKMRRVSNNKRYRPSLTAVVRVRNSETELRACLDALVGAAYPNLVIMAVDMGSADNSINSTYAKSLPHLNYFDRLKPIFLSSMYLRVPLRQIKLVLTRSNLAQTETRFCVSPVNILRSYQRRLPAGSFKIIRRKGITEQAVIQEVLYRIDTKLVVVMCAADFIPDGNTLARGVNYFRRRDIDIVVGRRIMPLTGSLWNAVAKSSEIIKYKLNRRRPVDEMTAPIVFARTRSLRQKQHNNSVLFGDIAVMNTFHNVTLRNSSLCGRTFFGAVVDMCAVFAAAYLLTPDQIMTLGLCLAAVWLITFAMMSFGEPNLSGLNRAALVLFAPFSYIVKTIAVMVIAVNRALSIILVAQKTLVSEAYSHSKTK